MADCSFVINVKGGEKDWLPSMTKGEIDEYGVVIDDNINDRGEVWRHDMKPKQASWRGMAKWPILWSFVTWWGHELLKMALGLGKDVVPT